MVTKRRSAVDGVFATTTDLINYKGTWNTDDIVVTDGFLSVGDGGGAKWRLTGNTIAASKTPALTTNGTLSDANGNEFAIDETTVNSKQFGAAVNGAVVVAGGEVTNVTGTDDGLALQAMFNWAKPEGTVKLSKGISVSSIPLIVDSHITVFGEGGSVDNDMTIFNGSWIMLADNAGFTADQSLLNVEHNGPSSITKRRFALLHRFGLFGNFQQNTFGNGLAVSAKNVVTDQLTILQFPENGEVWKDRTGTGNDGMNASLRVDCWTGYNRNRGMDLRRDAYSGDFIVRGGHVLWNESTGIYINQPNVMLEGVHVWWNYDGVIIDGTKANLGVRICPSCRIYDNAAAGVRTVNSPKNWVISGDITGNGNETRWTFYNPPLTSGDVTQNEQAAVFIDDAPINGLIDELNVGFLNDTGRQYYGVRSINSGSLLSIGSVISDGTTSTQADRAIVLTQPSNSTLHGQNVKSDMRHPGFIARGDINLNSNSILSQDKQSWWAWDLGTITAGVLDCTSTLCVLAEAAPVNVTDIAPTIDGALPQIIIRNSTANAVTIVNNAAKIRNNSGANVVLGLHQSVTYVAVSAGVYQQIA